MAKSLLQAVLLAALVVAAAFGVYENELLDSVADADRVHASPTAAGFEPEALTWSWTTTRGGVYQPLAWTSHVVGMDLAGTEGGPLHLVSLFLHALAAALVFLVFREITQRSASAWIGAALFALHPLTVEAFAFPAARGVLLATIFGSLAALFVAGHARCRCTPFVLGGILSFAAALLSHPAAALYLPVLVLVRERVESRLVVSNGERPTSPVVFFAPHAVLALATVGFALYLQLPDSAVPPGARLAGVFGGVAVALNNAFFPLRLSSFYPHAGLDGGLLGTATLVGIGGTLLLLGAGLLAGRRNAALRVGAIWFLGMLAAAQLLALPGEALTADRSVYLALPGLALVVGTALTGLTASRTARGVGFVVGLVLAGALGFVTRGTVEDWRNDVTVSVRDIVSTRKGGWLLGVEGNYMALRRLAVAQVALGGNTEARQHLETSLEQRDTTDTRILLAAVENIEGNHEAARAHLEHALERDPENPTLLRELARSRWIAKEFAEALLLYERAQAAGGSGFELKKGLGMTLTTLGRVDEGIAAFREAIAARPLDWGVRYLLAEQLLRKREVEEAREELLEVVRLNPEDILARQKLAGLAAQDGDMEKAVALMLEVTEIEPNLYLPQVTLGEQFIQDGRYQEALERINHALRVEPSISHGYVLFGDAYMGLKDYPRAASAYQAAIERKADPVMAYQRLGDALELAGELARAEAAFAKVLETKPDAFEVRFRVGSLQVRQGKLDEAVASYEAVRAQQPNIVKVQEALGDVYERKGDLASAVGAYRQAARSGQAHPDITDRAAWILATNADPALRNGEEALQLAQYSVQRTGERFPPMVECVAAALAELGRFDEAVAMQEKAIALFGELGQEVPAAATERLEGYRRQEPTRSEQGRL